MLLTVLDTRSQTRLFLTHVAITDGSANSGFPERFVGETVELARCDILLQLAVPRSRIEFDEPRSESREVLRREASYRVFKVV